MFQSMITDEESQCVIISGESGAGKRNHDIIDKKVSRITGGGGES